MSDNISFDDIEKRADELTKEKNRKVIPLVFTITGSDEKIIGYMTDPTRETKFRTLDKVQQVGPGTAASELLDSCLLTEHSDPRIASDDRFYIAAAFEALGNLEVALSVYKKK